MVALDFDGFYLATIITSWPGRFLMFQGNNAPYPLPFIPAGFARKSAKVL
jgi:hypothetical protein